MPDAETLRVLSPAIVLLLLVFGMCTAWIRDRNARVRDLKEQVVEWREAHRRSESARDTQAEIVHQALDVARTSEAVIAGLRSALARYQGGDSG